MKKLYYLLLICLPLNLIGQTIMQSDLPTAGTGFIMANDTDYVDVIPPGGTGQTWNYATLQNDVTDTTAFDVATGTPYAVSFPSANLSSHNPSDDSYIYFSNTSSGLFVNGVGSPDVNLVYTQPLLYIPVPFAYASNYSNTGRIQVDSTVFDSTLGTINVRFVHRIDGIFIGDGTGTLIIPSGTFPNVVRMKNTSLTYDSILVEALPGVYTPFQSTVSQTTSYLYLTTGLTSNFLLGIEADSLGTTSISSQYFLSSLSLSVPTITENKHPLAYPNPVSHSLNFKYLNENSTVTIYDISGKRVQTVPLLNNSVDIQSLADGVYHYEINLHDKVEKGSFVVKH